MRKFITGAAAVALALAGTIAGVSRIENAHAASVWYISPTGDDSKSCLDATTRACASLQHLLDANLVVSGDTVHVTQGTYNTPQTWNAYYMTGIGEGFTGYTIPNPINYINVYFDPGAILQRSVVNGVIQNMGTPLFVISNTQGVIFHDIVAYGEKNQPGYDLTKEHPYKAEIQLFAGGCEDVDITKHDSQCGQYVTLQNPTVKYAGNSCIVSQYIFSTIDGANIHDCGEPGDGLDHGIYLSLYGR